ncbi:MAG: PfkB family carbohydrate kinase [Saprospiraceae bacterium]|nr:PfkB family carbohydrate kinase [Saprospiraceae bacterium]
MKKFELLCIGHCCHDKTDDGYILGGSVSYASLIATSLGVNSAVLTSVGKDFLFKNQFELNHIAFYNIDADETTVFENRYAENQRIQYIHSRAKDISKNHVPDELCNIPIVLIGSIANEIDFILVDKFKNSIMGAIIQGSMRSWDTNGLVYSQKMDWNKLVDLDLIFLSDDDMRGMETEIPLIVSIVDHVILTHGEEGVSIFKGKKKYFYPSYPVLEIDATGAGDTFSTAYLLAFCKSNDIRYSAIYAHCAASIMVEDIGLKNSKSLIGILERMEKYHMLFPEY